MSGNLVPLRAASLQRLVGRIAACVAGLSPHLIKRILSMVVGYLWPLEAGWSVWRAGNVFALPEGLLWRRVRMSPVRTGPMDWNWYCLDLMVQIGVLRAEREYRLLV